MNRQKILKRCLLLAACAALLSSCATPKEVVYFQDLQQTDGTLAAVQAKEIRVRPDDKISIIVNSRDPQLTDLFNLPYVSRQLGQTLRSVTSTYGQSQGVSGYTVDSDGNIDFPVLGKIHVEGMTREEIGRCIKDELIGQDLVKDPIVTVEFMNLTVSVMGEVAKPGRYAIERDRITILDALSMAGDLTIYGRRDAVMVQRDRITILDALSMAGDLTIYGRRDAVMVQRMEGDTLQVYELNLVSGQDVYNSPAFYLQQNDLVYVAPNDVKVRESTVNGNNIRSTSFWISLGSLLTSVAVLITNIL